LGQCGGFPQFGSHICGKGDAVLICIACRAEFQFTGEQDTV
jgi:hypothetical protein